MKSIFLLIFSVIFLTNCNSTKMTQVDMGQFEGQWKLVGRSMFEGMEVKISKDNKGEFIGVLTKLNDNKYVQMFMEEGDLFTSGIKRNSNFEFELKEKKIASALFSAYGQSTSEKFDVEFAGKDKINLGKNGTDGQYVRVRKKKI